MCPGRNPATATATQAETDQQQPSASEEAVGVEKPDQACNEWTDLVRTGEMLVAPPLQQDVTPKKAVSPKLQINQQQKEQLAATKAIIGEVSAASTAVTMGARAAAKEATWAARTTAPAITRATAADRATVGARGADTT